MAEYMFFESENPYWSRQMQAGDPNRRKYAGWCCGASAVWCANILIKNMGPGDSDPSEGLAGILQVKYRWDRSTEGKQDLLNLLKQVGLRGEVHDNLDLDGALNRMATYPGVYHFMRYGEPPWHCMSADTRPGHYYRYDIEEGLFGYANTDEWKQGIKQRYQPCGRAWVVIKCGV